MSAGSFDAFDSPNLPPLVTMKVKIEGTVVKDKIILTIKYVLFTSQEVHRGSTLGHRPRTVLKTHGTVFINYLFKPTLGGE